MRGVIRSGLIVGAAATTGLVSAGPAALEPLRDVVVSAVDVSVAFVVDFGTAGVVVACVKVPAGDNGYDAISAFTEQEHEVAPTYNSSGLLCSINNVPNQNPNPACGQEVPGGYDYWSYWHGTTGSWVYASTGPSAAVTNGDVEGWRWEDPGAGNPSDAPPGAPPNYDAICGDTTSTSTPATTIPVGTSVPSASSPPVSPSGSTQGHSTTSAPTSAPGTATTMAPGTGVGSTTAVPSSIPTAGQRGEATKASAGNVHGEGAGNATPLVVTGAILAILGGAAAFRWRRRPRVP